MPAEFAATVRPHLDAVLEPGEALEGVVAVTRQSTFSVKPCALGVTDRRLVLQPLNRRNEPDGTPLSILPASLDAASLRGANDDWWNTEVLDYGALGLRLRTTEGEKLKLLMMEGGSGMWGRLGGGEAQQAGVEALAAWLRRQVG